MLEFSGILKKNNIRALGYKRIGKNIIVSTSDCKYVLKPKYKKNNIFEYLNNRNFNYYPEIYDIYEDYEITKYIDEVNIPKEKKINDLIYLVSLLHNKTTYYKDIDNTDYKVLYEDLMNNCEYLKDYYTDMISLIDSKIYMSPSEYLIALNITLIFDSIAYCSKKIDEWYELVGNQNKMRVCVIHNNLSLDHYLKGDEDNLISWDKSKIDIPVFDLYKLYLSHGNDFEFTSLLKIYEKQYPLKKEELLLLKILISMPLKIELSNNTFNDTQKIQKEVDKLIKTSKFVTIES